MSQADDSIRVLHVDDEPDLADLTKEMLKREDDRFVVDIATSAEEGLDRLSADTFDCIISDYDMPGQNGLDFLRAVRETYPDLPFILFTGKGSEEVASKAISAGITDYLQKHPGKEQYELLANRVINTIKQYRAERAVDETHHRFQTLVEETTDVIMIVEPDGTIGYATPSAERILGRSPEDFVGLNGFDLVHPDEVDQVISTFRELVENPQQRQTTEFRYEKPDGSYIWTEARGRNLLDDPVIEGIVVYVRDTAERKERELELEKTERRYQAIFNDPNILVGLLDVDGTVLDINDTALDYIDAEHEEVLDQPFWATPWFNHSEAVQNDVKEWIQRARGGEYVEFEVDLVRANGDPYVIQGVFRPVRNEEGEVDSLIISNREITEQRERERELERIRDFFDEAERLGDLGAWEFNKSSEVVWTDGTRRIHEVDDSFEPTIETGVKFYHPDDRPIIENAIEKTLEAGDPFDVEARLVTAEENERWVRTRGKPIDDGSVTIRGYIQDITEQKEREIERDQIISRVTDAIVEVDADWRFTLVNEQAESLYDMEEAYLLGRNFWDVFEAARGTRFEEEYRTVMETREPTSFVEYFSQLDGWFDIEAYPKDDGGLAFYFVNVTEQRKHERELERTNTILSTLIETMPVGVLAEDGSRNVLSINDRLLELFDVPGSPEDLIGLDCETFAEDVCEMFEDPDGFVDRIDQLVAEREPVDTDELQLSNGRTYLRSYRPLQLPSGDGHLWMYRDVTEHYETLSDLEEHQERLTLALEAGEMGIWELDVESGIVRTRSRRHDEIFGHDEQLEEWTYERFLDHVHPDDRELVERTYQDAIGGGTLEYECRIERADGAERWIRVMGEIFTEAEKPVRAVGVVSDITRRKAREEELQRTNERLEQFASMVSHDLRNPISVATGRLELYRNDREESDLDAVETALDRIQEITTDLTALARHGQTSEDPEAVDVDELAGEIWELLDTKSASLQTDPIRLFADKSQLKTLLDNLFRNAIDHGGPDVTVRVGPLDDGFYVEDTGEGISPADQEQIFEDGYSTRYSGTGIGLTIVKRIVEAHGWVIDVMSGAEGGARFEVTNIDRP